MMFPASTHPKYAPAPINIAIASITTSIILFAIIITSRMGQNASCLLADGNKNITYTYFL